MVPFLDLQAQYQSIKDEILPALQEILTTGRFILGPAVEGFEKDFARYCEAEHAVGVNSGTSALHLALLAAGVGPRDEVITVPLTFVATAAAINYTGARPVYVDVDPHSLTMDPSLIEKALSPRTKAILPVHLHGQPADMDPILDLARQKDLIVIEDAAQAHGARYKGSRVGGLGHLGCFSFYPGKNLGAYGEGGAVVTNDPDYAQRMRQMRDWGQTAKYQHDLIGFNYRLEGFQGAVLGVKLPHLDAWNQARRDHAAAYAEALKHLDLKLPGVMEYAEHVFHVFAIRHPARDRIQQILQEREIYTGIHYPIPVHLNQAYAQAEYPAGSFPVAEEAARELLSLPMFAELTGQQIKEVAAALEQALEESA